MNVRTCTVRVVCLMVLSTLSIAAARAQTSSATDRTTVTRLEQRWVADIRSGNRGDLATILSDDYRDINWQGYVRDKTALLATLHRSADIRQHISQLRVRVWGDTAVATGINEVHSASKGWTVEVPFTDVFARIDGHWRAVASQETLRKPAARASKS